MAHAQHKQHCRITSSKAMAIQMLQTQLHGKTQLSHHPRQTLSPNSKQMKGPSRSNRKNISMNFIHSLSPGLSISKAIT